MRISLCTAIILTTSLNLLFAFTVSGQNVKDVNIKLELNNESFQSAIKKIEAATQFRFVYRNEDIKGLNHLTMPGRERSVGETLDLILKNSAFSYRQLNNSIMVVKAVPAPATQEKTEDVGLTRHTVKVYVTDEQGEFLAFANVTVRGYPRLAEQTNQDGFVNIFSVKDEDVLLVSFVGYITQSVTIGKQETIHVRLVKDITTNLKEVTIVSNGYQTLPKERSTGAFATITAKDLEKIPVPNIIQRLEGLVPGLQVYVGSGDRSFDYNNSQQSITGGTRTVGQNDYNMNIRGTSTVSAESFPLVVIDGAVSNLDLSTINPNDIDNVTFLKDAASASIWGIRAANGVIVITTKKGSNNVVPKINFSTSFSLAEKPNLNYLKTMNSAQALGYEKELVDRGFITDLGNDSYYNYASANVRNKGSLLALQLKAGSITQAQYDDQVKSLSAIDNRSQISKYLLQAAQSQQYNLSVSGGTDFSNYYYSASYSKELPNAIGSSAGRLTINLTHNWKLFKVADLSINVKGASFNYVNNGIALNSLYTPSSSTMMPYSLLKDANGNNLAYDRAVPSAYTATLSPNRPSWQYSFLDELANNDNTQKDNDYTATINLRVPIIKGLSASALYSTERTFSKTRVYYNPQSYFFRDFINYYTGPTASLNSIGITSGGILNLTNIDNNNYTARGQLDYNANFGKIHQLSALAGMELRQTEMGQGLSRLYGYNTSSGLSTGINAGNTNSDNIGYATITGYNYNLSSPTDQADKRRRYLSYFGNAAYTLSGKYVLTGSVRYDDYNNFGLDRKYRATPAWSGGVKWNITDEEFMKPLSWISNLGLRATYGVNGNISTTIYPFTWITLNTDNYTGQAAASILAPANPQLRWEKTYVTNIGLDFGFLNSRITGSADYYRKNGKDILASFIVNPTYLGTTTSYLTQNSSKLNGRGVDIGLNGLVYNGTNVKWTIGGTFSYNTNKLNDPRYTSQYTSSAYATTSYYANPAGITKLDGYPTDEMMVFRYAGLDANGLTQVYDANGNIIKATTAGIPTLSALKYAGRRTAPVYGSWNTSLRYKPFTFYALATYQFGNVFLKPTATSYATSPYNVKYDLNADIAKRWQSPGDEFTTTMPGLNGTATAVNASLVRYAYSDINVLKGDYIRLRELSLSYQVPVNFLNKVRIKSANIGFAVRNLGLLWTANKQGYDPDFVNSIDRTYNLPASRSYILSLNVNL
ncbi:SusC/RagA family TonB-linked outer membrane protein [Mucilaginibacter sp.]|uniref:SusC/RagA family TonB-linked outer membrane protein n=1 Tax=Mucilaginibacter sp. TaxID=1882438 RepID=UPI002ED2D3F0